VQRHYLDTNLALKRLMDQLEERILQTDQLKNASKHLQRIALTISKMKWTNKKYICFFNLLHCVYQFRKYSNQKQTYVLLTLYDKTFSQKVEGIMLVSTKTLDTTIKFSTDWLYYVSNKKIC